MIPQPDPQRMSRTLLTVTFIPRKRCENCRTRPAVVVVKRTHRTLDFHPAPEHIGSYTREERLCQRCANEVVREESWFLDTVVDDGKPLWIQSKDCIAMNNDLIHREDCGCDDCHWELGFEQPEVVHKAGTHLE